MNNQFNVHNVKGDGSCLFYAVAYGMLYYVQYEGRNRKIPFSEYKDLANDLRNVVVQHLIKHKNDNNIRPSMAWNTFILAPIVQSKEKEKKIREMPISNYMSNHFANLALANYTENQRVNMYIEAMKQSCTWGGQLEASILATYVQDTYGIKGIVVHDQNFHKMRFGDSNNHMVKNNLQFPAIHLRLKGVEIRNGRTIGNGSHFQFITRKRQQSSSNRISNEELDRLIQNGKFS